MHGPFSALRLLDLGTAVNGRSQYELLDDLWYQTEPAVGSDVNLVVPKGFVTDFASVPRFFWRLFPPSGVHNKAAVLHDWLYTRGECTQFFADAIFRDAMFLLGTPYWKRCLMYWAVRIFGGPNFRAKRIPEDEEATQ